MWGVVVQVEYPPQLSGSADPPAAPAYGAWPLSLSSGATGAYHVPLGYGPAALVLAQQARGNTAAASVASAEATSSNLAAIGNQSTLNALNQLRLNNILNNAFRVSSGLPPLTAISPADQPFFNAVLNELDISLAKTIEQAGGVQGLIGQIARVMQQNQGAQGPPVPHQPLPQQPPPMQQSSYLHPLQMLHSGQPLGPPIQHPSDSQLSHQTGHASPMEPSMQVQEHPQVLQSGATPVAESAPLPSSQQQPRHQSPPTSPAAQAPPPGLPPVQGRPPAQGGCIFCGDHIGALAFRGARVCQSCRAELATGSGGKPATGRLWPTFVFKSADLPQGGGEREDRHRVHTHRGSRGSWVRGS